MARRSVLKSREKEEYEEEENGRNLKKILSGINMVAKGNFFILQEKLFVKKNGHIKLFWYFSKWHVLSLHWKFWIRSSD